MQRIPMDRRADSAPQVDCTQHETLGGYLRFSWHFRRPDGHFRPLAFATDRRLTSFMHSFVHAPLAHRLDRFRGLGGVMLRFLWYGRPLQHIISLPGLLLGPLGPSPDPFGSFLDLSRILFRVQFTLACHDIPIRHFPLSTVPFETVPVLHARILVHTLCVVFHPGHDLSSLRHS